MLVSKEVLGVLLMEQNDEYQVGRRYLSLESMAKITDTGEYILAPMTLLHK